MQDINDLINENKGLVFKQIRKFGLVGDPEALSLGYEALYRAIQTYDTSGSTKFSTYATVCIYNRLGSYIRSLNTNILQNTISYETPVDENGKTLYDKLESNKTADGKILAECGVSIIYQKIQECIDAMPNQLHRYIASIWVESEFKASHTEIARIAGCTQSYVSQTIKIFKNSLKKKLGEY